MSIRSSFSLSLVVHALGLLLLAFLIGQQAATHAPAKLTWIEMDPLPKTAPDKQAAKKEADPKKRIVQTTAGVRTKTAAPDAFLGEHTQTVDRQTVSRDQKITAPTQAKTAARTAERAQPKSQPQSQPQTADHAAPVPDLASLGVPVMPAADKIQRVQQEREAVAPQMGGVPQDYVKGLKENETTTLNTREYVFFGYFQRIRTRLDHAWSGVLRDRLIKLYRSGRQLAADMDHTTRVLVTLNSTGEIVRVQVVGESGTHDLDDAAVKAFNQAGPFPNPPHGIVDASGQIQIRWDFVLKT